MNSIFMLSAVILVSTQVYAEPNWDDSVAYQFQQVTPAPTGSISPSGRVVITAGSPVTLTYQTSNASKVQVKPEGGTQWVDLNPINGAGAGSQTWQNLPVGVYPHYQVRAVSAADPNITTIIGEVDLTVVAAPAVQAQAAPQTYTCSLTAVKKGSNNCIIFLGVNKSLGLYTCSNGAEVVLNNQPMGGCMPSFNLSRAPANKTAYSYVKNSEPVLTGR